MNVETFTKSEAAVIEIVENFLATTEAHLDLFIYEMAEKYGQEVSDELANLHQAVIEVWVQAQRLIR